MKDIKEIKELLDEELDMVTGGDVTTEIATEMRKH